MSNSSRKYLPWITTGAIIFSLWSSKGWKKIQVYNGIIKLSSIECSRKSFHILNCHLRGTSEFKQVVMVALSSQCLTIFWFFQIQSWLGLVHTMRLLLKHFTKRVNLIAKQGDFCAIFMLHWNNAAYDRNSILLWAENSIQNNIILA